ncbi:MAG: hypothetical protein JSR96_12100 [Proteobacteria bacterium]|nr:hypothetical protein [Pseudomonadota bacterium]
MTDQTSAAPPPGPMAGVVITAIVVVLIIAWIAIGLQFMAVTSLVGGFLFLWYWANNEQLEIRRLPPALIGAVVGIGIGWFMLYAATKFGGAGLAAGVGVLVLALYLDVIKAVPMVVNTATMLYVTIAAAPLVQLHVNWTELVLSTVIGGLFFGGAVEGLKRLTAKATPAPGG